MGLVVSNSTLIGVRLLSRDLPRHCAVMRAVTGVEGLSGPESVVYRIGAAAVELVGVDSEHSPTGLETLRICISDLDACEDRLGATGVSVKRVGDQLHGDRLHIEPSWTYGITIELSTPAPDSVAESVPPAAVLDHVAVLVEDVEDAAKRFELILGCPPDALGVHPLGTSIAARFLIGEQMIELLAPLPDQESVLSARLARAGEGPFALAIISRDLAAISAAVEAAGGRLVAQAPHVIVHPNDAAGIPIQLTPRVRH